MTSGTHQDLSWLDALSPAEQRREIDRINSRKSIKSVSRYINEENFDLYRVVLINDESAIYNGDGELSLTHNTHNPYVLTQLDVDVMLDTYRRTNPITTRIIRKH